MIEDYINLIRMWYGRCEGEEKIFTFPHAKEVLNFQSLEACHES